MVADDFTVEARLRLGAFTLDVAYAGPLRGCLAVFGPSGAGKSTLLRLIAGFLKPDEGRIAYGDECWCDTAAGIYAPPHRRRIGVVFQDGRLFPHLTVEQNLSYAARRAVIAAPENSVDAIVRAFDLGALLSRRPQRLSGGERQRVALARTLLAKPDLVLLDEPLSALDHRRKSEILPYLEDLPGRFGAPVIYVSHNTEEVIQLADRTLIMNDGRIEAVGPTAEILTAYGARDGVSGFGAVIAGTVIAHDDDFRLTRVKVGEAELALPKVGEAELALPQNRVKPVGARVAIRIDARNVAVARHTPEGLSIRNILAGTITAVVSQPETPFGVLTIDCAGATVKAQITRAAICDLGLAQGQTVYALIKSASFDLT